MRLHTLEITAFGPFADTVTVDFDALSEASVFLLCGDTGAGKTTVLDAVCFAFYGDVPSERSAAKQLRSHHAADGVAPRVVLDASLAGRRFRFTRSPQWQRPKKRGTGLTTQQAHVLVEEAVVAADGTGWRSLTNRLDEAGHLVTDLLGMTLGQFSQVVLLPQGQFDTFLRASSDDRHKVLTQLFRTRRFEDVERWLSDRRTTLRRAGERHHDTVAGLLHRVSEATGADLPSDWDVADLSEPALHRRDRGLDRVARGACRRAGRLHRDGAGRRGPGAGLRDRGPRRRAPPPRAPAAARLGARRTSGTRGHRRPGRRRPSAPGQGPPGRDGGAARPGRRPLGRRPRARPHRRDPRPAPGGGAAGGRARRPRPGRARRPCPPRHRARRRRPQLPPPRPRARRDHDPPDRGRAASPPPRRRARPGPPRGRRPPRPEGRSHRAGGDPARPGRTAPRVQAPSSPSWPGGSRSPPRPRSSSRR